jgi:hypothetical protein
MEPAQDWIRELIINAGRISIPESEKYGLDGLYARSGNPLMILLENYLAGFIRLRHDNFFEENKSLSHCLYLRGMTML